MRGQSARKRHIPAHHTRGYGLEYTVGKPAGIHRYMNHGCNNVQRTGDKRNEQHGFDKWSHIYNVFLSKELQPVETGCVALRVIPPMSPCMKFIAILAVWHIAG